jgi:hypothetical protein
MALKPTFPAAPVAMCILRIRTGAHWSQRICDMRIDEFVLHYAALFVRRELDGVVTSLAAFLDQALRDLGVGQAAAAADLARVLMTRKGDRLADVEEDAAPRSQVVPHSVPHSALEPGEVPTMHDLDHRPIRQAAADERVLIPTPPRVTNGVEAAEDV